MAEVEKGNNSMNKAIIRSANGYTAEIYTHGAHVTSWKSPSGEDLLFLSKNAIFNPPTAIRGGIPVCFPQFSDMGPCKTQHGFARNTEFTITENTTDSVTMQLRNEGEDNRTPGFSPPSDFPQKFILTCKVSLDTEGSLHQELSVKNPSTATESLSFTCALHTYLNLRKSDIKNVAIENLKGCRYLDSLQGRKECVEGEEKVVFPGEVDRIYLAVPDTLKIIDNDGSAGTNNSEKEDEAGIKIEKSGFPDAVVWNPAAVKAAKMADFGDDEWQQMVCVEVAVAGSGAIKIEPGQQWTGRQILSLF
jgi:glucose-6-phosphate 1-epimerase